MLLTQRQGDPIAGSEVGEEYSTLGENKYLEHLVRNPEWKGPLWVEGRMC